LVTNSLQQAHPPSCATALVGDTRLNVATHYVSQITPEFQQQPSTTDALSLDDTTRDIEPNDTTYDSKCNIQLETSKKEMMKIISIPNSSHHFSANKNMETLASNQSNVQFNAAATFGIEKGNIETIPHVAMIPSNLVVSAIDSRNFTLSPETTDCDSADLESEVSLNEGSYHSSGPKFHTAMPILEDGLSSGHASDLEDDVIYSSSGSVLLKKQQQLQQQTHHHHHQGRFCQLLHHHQSLPHKTLLMLTRLTQWR
jgi:hypothetical protein